MELVTASEFARLTGVSPAVVRQAIRDSQLPALRIGRRDRIDVSLVRDRLRGSMSTVNGDAPPAQ